MENRSPPKLGMLECYQQLATGLREGISMWAFLKHVVKLWPHIQHALHPLIHSWGSFCACALSLRNKRLGYRKARTLACLLQVLFGYRFEYCRGEGMQTVLNRAFGATYIQMTASAAIA